MRGVSFKRLDMNFTTIPRAGQGALFPVDKFTWRCYNNDKKTWHKRIDMEKEEILAISRRENKNRDLAEAATAQQAGNIAGRVGACVCCLVSVVFVWATGTMLYSPWVIYFSILGTHSLVTYRKKERKTELTLTIMYFAMFLLFLVLFAVRLVGVRG
jgi:Flp pilus assembly protein TadB